MKKQIIGQQGEVRIVQIGVLPPGAELRRVARARNYIISHSESGHHHILSGGELLERVDVPAGMKVFYAILDQPEKFFQDSPQPHGQFDLAPALYEFRVSREFDPFAEQIRRVAD